MDKYEWVRKNTPKRGKIMWGYVAFWVVYLSAIGFLCWKLLGWLDNFYSNFTGV